MNGISLPANLFKGNRVSVMTFLISILKILTLGLNARAERTRVTGD